MLVLVNLWEKTALDFLVTSANASQNAKKNLALRGSPYFFVLVQKSDFSMGRGPILRGARVFEKKTGWVLLPCVGDAGPRENGARDHAQCRDNVGQSSLLS